jgi:uncharacterized protein
MADQALQNKLTELEEQYSKTKYNKATNKYLGILRAKMARIKKDMATKKGTGGVGFSVKKTGDATVVLVGFPNAGQSSLLRVLTNVESKVAGYAFTTIEVIPGMLQYNGAKIQVLDLPGLIRGAHEGKGDGTKIGSVIRTSDLLLFLVDINKIDQLYELIEELNLLGIRPNRHKPEIRIEEKKTGGITIAANRHKIPEKLLIVGIMNEFSIFNADIYFYEDATADDIVDLLAGNVAYISGVVALNKIDTAEEKTAQKIKSEIEAKTKMTVVSISAMRDTNITALKDILFRKLDLIRIYLKPKDGDADFSKPLVAKGGSTVMELAKAVHSKTAKSLRYAFVEGQSVKFKNQKMGIDHVLMDEDVVTFIYAKT